MPIMPTVRVQRRPTAAASYASGILSTRASRLLNRVQVGIHRDAPDYPDGRSLSMVALSHEFGLGTVPERSFLRKTLLQNRRRYIKWLKSHGRRVLRDELLMRTVMAQLADKLEQDVKATIRQMRSPPLTPATVARKGHDRLLIESGLLIRNIKGKIKKQTGRRS